MAGRGSSLSARLLLAFLTLCILPARAQLVTRGAALLRLSGVQNGLLQVKLTKRMIDGPGIDLSYGLYPGNTIQRETFETQFIQDVSMAGNLSTTRIFVTDVRAGAVSTSWEPNTVIVTFLLFERDRSNDTTTLSRVVQDLTGQIQDSSSRFYAGLILRTIDPHFGLVALSWDVSLLLRYALDVVGKEAIASDEINEGSTRFCLKYNYTTDLRLANPHLDQPGNHSLNATLDFRPYCEFEMFYRHDLARSLNISLYRIQVLYVKNASLDSVLVHTRFSPPANWSTAEHNISTTIDNLATQLQNVTSSLYLGNVTVRADRSWGLSGSGAMPRGYNPFVRYGSMPTSTDEYERCKAVHRCARASIDYNQSAARVDFIDQLYEAGRRFPSALFDDFEDWRAGTYGWAHRGAMLPRTGAHPKPRGAHFSPMAFDSLGPTVPTHGFLWNRGLVLDNMSLAWQLEQLDRVISGYQAKIDFMEDNVETALLDAKARARIDVRRLMERKINDTIALRDVQVSKRAELSVSQCALVNCTLLFNTSDLTLTGAIEANGTLALTPQGTEVAVFTFDSIQLGPEVAVTLAGQRALVLQSRSSVSLNTTLSVTPGTLGGFPGGYGVGQRPEDRLTDQARDLYLRDLNHLNATVSNNINGPGSGSVRVYRYSVQTRGADVDEVQRVSTRVQRGQSLHGAFRLGYKGYYTTRLIPHDATAAAVKAALEGGLNACDPYDRRECLRSQKRAGRQAGVGLVNVTRSRRSDDGAYSWNVTFTSAVGDVPQLSASHSLTGLGAGIGVESLVQGNSLSGAFVLRFLGNSTRRLPFDADAAGVQAALLADVVGLVDAEVVRTDPTGGCEDGLCKNGPTPAYGYTWTLTLTTEHGNVSPTSPTSNQTTQQGPTAVLQVVSQLRGQGAGVEVEAGHGRASHDRQRAFNATRPFSLAFGGGGGGYGGDGGRGYGHNPLPRAYGDMHISDLLGGSGGAMGDVDPAAIHAYQQPQGRGGAGGGAVQLIAINDIVIGSRGGLVVDAQDGEAANQYGGGGGAGGAVLLAAGGVIVHEGLISAKGGQGGKTQTADGFGGGGGAGGRAAMYAQSVSVRPGGRVEVGGGQCPRSQASAAPLCTRHGGKGSVYQWTQSGAQYYVDPSSGAFSSQRSLYLTSEETTPTVSGVIKDTPYPRDGPEYVLQTTRPERVTFYAKLGTLGRGLDPRVRRGKQHYDFGAMFALLGGDGGGGDVRANSSIGLGITFQTTIQHGVDFYYTPAEHGLNRQRLSQVLERVDLWTWYKVDIILYWDSKTYDIRVDDVTYVRKSPFSAPSFSRIGLYSFPRGEVWFDEIFAGTDSTMKLQCPLISSTGVQMDRPLQNSWPLDAIGRESYNHPMTRWLSHISDRTEYDYNNGGLVPFDGEAHQAYMSDIQVRFATGDKVPAAGSLMAGVLTTLKGSTPSRSLQSAALTSVGDTDFWTSGEDVAGNKNLGHTSTYFWYGEHTYEQGMAEYRGGVASCSTDDLVTWRFEGIMLHYANISDMVYGSPGPFQVERPKVLYNNKTGKYVMWMGVDNANRSLGLAGIAISDYRNGPYDFIRSFYPDGNQTRDQMVYQAPDGTAYLGRTYYQDIEYVMPERVMQPIWDSVRNPDGSINFPLNYHRAYFDSEYDDYHDIFLQRWRKEDIEWKVVCINRVTGKNRTVDRVALAGGDWCTSPFEYKVVEGFGYPAIPSRYIDPMDDRNSLWSPKSVPGVQAQPWKFNYQDGECGIHKTNDNYEAQDPKLELDRVVPDRSNCSNAADNEPHRTVADKLIGERHVVFTRRAKYVAISRLTDDYLDTSGVLTSFEGELEGEEHLISLITQSGQFQWGTGDQLGSTYFPQVSSEFSTAKDWARRFHQYERQYNDRALYSLACVLDGDCPVDFKSQITVGNT